MWGDKNTVANAMSHISPALSKKIVASVDMLKTQKGLEIELKTEYNAKISNKKSL